MLWDKLTTFHSFEEIFMTQVTQVKAKGPIILSESKNFNCMMQTVKSICFDVGCATGKFVMSIGEKNASLTMCNCDPYGDFCNEVLPKAIFNGIAKSYKMDPSIPSPLEMQLQIGSFQPVVKACHMVSSC